MAYNSEYDNTVFHNMEHAASDMDQDLLTMRALWRAVITQALMDAASTSKRSHHLADKARARAWLSGNSQNFLDVCMLADLDHEYVKTQAHLAMSRGYKWRNDRRVGININLKV